MGKNILDFIYIYIYRKSCHLLDNGEKYFRVGQATDDNMAHVH